VAQALRDQDSWEVKVGGDQSRTRRTEALEMLHLLKYAARTGSADIAGSESRAALLGCRACPLSADRREKAFR
jgi:hypothetical protein